MRGLSCDATSRAPSGTFSLWARTPRVGYYSINLRWGSLHAAEGGGESRSAVRTPHAGHRPSRSSCWTGILLCAEIRTNRRRDPSPMQVEGSQAPTLPPGTGPGSQHAAHPAGRRGRGWGRLPTPALLGKGLAAGARRGPESASGRYMGLPFRCRREQLRGTEMSAPRVASLGWVLRGSP